MVVSGDVELNQEKEAWEGCNSESGVGMERTRGEQQRTVEETCRDSGKIEKAEVKRTKRRS